ncbi:malonyl-ACP O-methyltransferase BioC [Pasteurellaceae bacterium HPA106]|uniref:malonyl-ACP O-methyltransferase BioC n=1 Tax=Spirabiliibacterium pneumoniae TaxID=221400 RepID=UPI001AAC77AA|nr:malonyl-ACP O-methyltransferase BioC [Spirabiliibacterium pneumoniae]MBE2895338.1 malonyl-ACP O-methyltransferase BioC [Spirabiliibacterium pneumoniae]
MSEPLDKALIAQRFAKALPSYDHQASVQRAVNRRMLTLLREKCGQAFANVLEIGCGSGDLTALLHQQLTAHQWWHNDLNAAAVQTQAQRWQGDDTHFLCADGEYLDRTLPATQAFDLLLSGSTVQWFHAPERIVTLGRAYLRRGGVLLFSTFLPDNCAEIRRLTGKGLDYPTCQQWQRWLVSGFELVNLEAQRHVLTFPSPRAVLKHLKATGVTATAQMHWTKHRLQAFEQAYCAHYSSQTGVRLTYHPLIILAKRT